MVLIYEYKALKRNSHIRYVVVSILINPMSSSNFQSQMIIAKVGCAFIDNANYISMSTFVFKFDIQIYFKHILINYIIQF